MSQFKLCAVLAIVPFLFGIATIDVAVAGEKFKGYGASTTVKWEQIEVGDKEGHVIALSKSKQIYINEITGEKSASISIGLMDFNIKTGMGSGHGYGITTTRDGDKQIRSWEGKSVEKGHMKGTYSYIMGTGKYEGIKGGGTWDAYSLAPGQSYIEVEGESEIPEK